MIVAGAHELSMASYNADPCPEPSLRSSLIKTLLLESPSHAWERHPRLNQNYRDAHSAFFDLGAAAHERLTGGEERIAVCNVLNDKEGPVTDWRKKDAQTFKAKAYADGRTPVLVHQVEQIERMVRSLLRTLERHRDASEAFTAPGGLFEQSWLWQERGVWIRVRPDWTTADGKVIYDYKTDGRSANPEVLSRTIFDKGYDIQIALQMRGAKAVHGVDAEARLVCQETEEPHAATVVGLNPYAIGLANLKIDRAIDIWRRCLETNEWSSYPLETCYVEPPAYHAAHWGERAMSEGGPDAEIAWKELTDARRSEVTEGHHAL